jgi:hypothetical protein
LPESIAVKGGVFIPIYRKFCYSLHTNDIS